MGFPGLDGPASVASVSVHHQDSQHRSRTNRPRQTIATVVPAEEPNLEEASGWLREKGLAQGSEPESLILRRYAALSKCKFGNGVSDIAKDRFL